MQRPKFACPIWILNVLLTAVSISLASPTAEARPAYKKVFEETYPAVKQANSVTCAACHGEAKTERNNYGQAMTEVLAEKNVKDADQIATALKKIESQPSAVAGKSFGDLLKEGKLPASE